MILLKDRFYSWQLLVVIAAFVAVLLADHFIWRDAGITTALKDVRKETYGALATIFGALLGFVITAFAIVVSLADTRVMRKLHAKGKDRDVVAGFSRTTGVIGLATVVALSGIFADSGTVPWRPYELVVLFMSIWSAAALVGVVILIEALVVAVNESKG